MIADGAIVPHVGMMHEKPIGSNYSILLHFVGTMDCDLLSKYVVITNAQPRRLTLKFQILRRVADHATSMKPIARPDRCQPGEINVWTDVASLSYFHPFINDRIRPNAHGRVDFCVRMNDGCFMNHLHFSRPNPARKESRKSRIEIAQFSQRSVILGPLGSRPTKDDMV